MKKIIARILRRFGYEMIPRKRIIIVAARQAFDGHRPIPAEDIKWQLAFLLAHEIGKHARYSTAQQSIEDYYATGKKVYEMRLTVIAAKENRP